MKKSAVLGIYWASSFNSTPRVLLLFKKTAIFLCSSKRRDLTHSFPGHHLAIADGMRLNLHPPGRKPAARRGAGYALTCAFLTVIIIGAGVFSAAAVWPAVRPVRGGHEKQQQARSSAKHAMLSHFLDYQPPVEAKATVPVIDTQPPAERRRNLTVHRAAVSPPHRAAASPPRSAADALRVLCFVPGMGRVAKKRALLDAIRATCPSRFCWAHFPRTRSQQRTPLR